LEKNEKTAWKWVVSLGIAIGVGVQLHVIVMAIFLSLTFCIFLFSLKKNIGVWKKWVLVLLVICFLNASQIINEINTNFHNTKILFSSASRDSSAGVSKFNLIKNDVNCNIEANAYFLSSYGSSNCTYEFLNPSAYVQFRTANLSKFSQDAVAKIAMLLAIAFSGLGYYLLVRYGKNEEEKNKVYFLRLVALYAVIAFVIMISLSTDKFNDLRYLTPTFFIPFVLLGFIVKFVSEKVGNKNMLLISISVVALLLIYTNGSAILDQVVPLLEKDRTCSSHSTTLGELEPVADYLISNSNGNKMIYFGGDKAFRVVYTPLAYILKKHNIDSREIGINPDLSESDGPTYIVSCKSGLKDYYPQKEVGNISVFKLK
jgi:hypothetical protein